MTPTLNWLTPTRAPIFKNASWSVSVHCSTGVANMRRFLPRRREETKNISSAAPNHPWSQPPTNQVYNLCSFATAMAIHMPCGLISHLVLFPLASSSQSHYSSLHRTNSAGEHHAPTALSALQNPQTNVTHFPTALWAPCPALCLESLSIWSCCGCGVDAFVNGLWCWSLLMYRRICKSCRHTTFNLPLQNVWPCWSLQMEWSATDLMTYGSDARKKHRPIS
jgi:hypothetical protein